VVDIRFIAKISGVSVSTVSRVINHSKPVSPELQSRVMEAVRKYDYTPNAIARQMISRRAHLIGIVLTNIANQFQASQLALMEECALERGYHAIVFSTYGSIEKLREVLLIMKERCVDSVISMVYFTEGEKEVVRKFTEDCGIPIIFPNMCMKNTKGKFIRTTVDEFQGAFDMTEYLIAKGHTRIGCLFPGTRLSLRKSGFLAAMQKNGLRVRPEYVICEPVEEDTFDRLKKLEIGTDFPTVWFCEYDMLAMRFMICMMQRGLKIPEDVSVAGFDDIPFAEEIGLTTIRQPIDVKAWRQVTIAIALADGESIDKYDDYIPYHLIERFSVRNLQKSKEG
jgi:LacI family transcriptional regulator